MDQKERREYLINRLKDERIEYRKIVIPDVENDQRRLLRALMNVRLPGEIAQEFLDVQDAYLKEVIREKGIVSVADVEFNSEGLGIWKGDITRLAADAVVNAANSGMTGCYVENHNCIDNCIHTYAGVQMRYECARIIQEQGHEEPTGQAKITPGYNLPCRYVLHTVGPIVQGSLTEEHERLLASCYRSCMELAAENNLESVAFCCISTGVFMFPNERAAEIAVETVKKYLDETGSGIKVIFNVFKDIDYLFYKNLLK